MTDYSIILTTIGSPEEARKIAEALVQRKQAACVNIVPQIESVYRWQGAVESTCECLLIIKTTEDAFPLVQQTIQELHTYELPECLLLRISDGSEKYFAWIKESLS